MERPPRPPASVSKKSIGIGFGTRRNKPNANKPDANRLRKTRKAIRNMIIRLVGNSRRTNENFKTRFPTERDYLHFLGKLAARYLDKNATNEVLRNFPYPLNETKNNSVSDEHKDGFIEFLIDYAKESDANELTTNNFLKAMRNLKISPPNMKHKLPKNEDY
jgi:hypothetical protein